MFALGGAISKSHSFPDSTSARVIPALYLRLNAAAISSTIAPRPDAHELALILLTFDAQDSPAISFRLRRPSLP